MEYNVEAMMRGSSSGVTLPDGGAGNSSSGVVLPGGRADSSFGRQFVPKIQIQLKRLGEASLK